MATPAKTFSEDIEIGRVLETGSMKMEATDIRSFAIKFDPQPYHFDREAGEASLFGGLCASGWHVAAVMISLVSDQLAREETPLIGSGQVSWLEWYRPAFEGDHLSAHMTITDRSRSENKTDHGLIECDIAVHNQEQKKVMALSTELMIESKRPEDD